MPVMKVEVVKTCLIKHSDAGLVISPVTYIELAPAFGGDVTLQEQFLSQVGVEWSDLWTAQDTRSAHALWAEHVKRKRSGITGKRPLADGAPGPIRSQTSLMGTRVPMCTDCNAVLNQRFEVPGTAALVIEHEVEGAREELSLELQWSR